MKRAAVVLILTSLWIVVSTITLALWTIRLQAVQHNLVRPQFVEPAQDLEAVRSAMELEAWADLVVSRTAWTNEETLQMLQNIGRFESQVERLDSLGWEPGAVAARFRLVRMILEIEQGYASSQSLYPLDPQLVDRPEDPFAPGMPLRYEPAADGLGYRVWSRGPDRQDDGGAPGADIVFERLSATTRAALAN